MAKCRRGTVRITSVRPPKVRKSVLQSMCVNVSHERVKSKNLDGFQQKEMVFHHTGPSWRVTCAQTTAHFRAGRPLRHRDTYQYTSTLPRPQICPTLPHDHVPD